MPPAGVNFTELLKKVHEYLIELHLVAEHFAVGELCGDIELQLLRFDFRSKDLFERGKDFIQIARTFVERKLTLFDATHVKDIVDQVQQMIARSLDLGEVFLHALGISYVACC